MNDKVYSELTTILREFNEATNRRDVKIELYELYKRAFKEDGKIIEVFINLLNKLPNFERLEPIGELELTTNFLDPIFSPLFHNPSKNKHFIWLNRQNENTGSLRPDGIMVSTTNRAENVTLGYCEVKPKDIESNLELAFNDLVRIATLSRDLMSRKENKKAICIQAIGYKVITYYVEETLPGIITTMSEILSFDVPNNICNIADLISKSDQLKRVQSILDTQCQCSYKYSRPSTTDIDNNINPKLGKQRNASFSLV